MNAQERKRAAIRRTFAHAIRAGRTARRGGWGKAALPSHFSGAIAQAWYAGWNSINERRKPINPFLRDEIIAEHSRGVAELWQFYLNQ